MNPIFYGLSGSAAGWLVQADCVHALEDTFCIIGRIINVPTAVEPCVGDVCDVIGVEYVIRQPAKVAEHIGNGGALGGCCCFHG